MKILYIGCVESSYIFLETLINAGANICGVIKKSSSKTNSDFVDLSPLCLKNRIKYCDYDKMNEDEILNFIQQVKPDIGFCFGWSHLLSEKIIKSVKGGFVGFHPAALPYNRGRHPIIWALALGLEKTASTFFMIDVGADTGDIVSQCYIDIDICDDARTLMDKIINCGKIQLIELFKNLANGKIHYVKQDCTVGNTWRKRSKVDGSIDWRMSSYNIYNLVRALTKPYIGAHFIYEGKEHKVWKVEMKSDVHFKNIEPGKIIDIEDDGKPVIKTGDGLIKMIEYDKIELSVGEYL